MWSNEARDSSIKTRRADGECKAKEKINSIPGFEYAGGYTNADCYVDIKCAACGNISRHYYGYIRRKGVITCPYCAELEKRELDRINKETAVIYRMMRSYRKQISAAKVKAKIVDEAIHCCPICGKPTIRRCCSDDCQRTYSNRVKEQNRRAKIKNALVDADITLPELYRRDGGICYICGGLCDWTDCDQQEDGTIIAGNNYPSIDHVIPLSKGGLHSWDNVKLSHRICNSIKSNSYAPLVKNGSL